MTTLITRTAARIVAPLIFVTAAILFIQGHNSIGGGFVSAVLIVSAIALLYIAYGTSDLTRLLNISPSTLNRRLLVSGLLLIIITGSVPILLNMPFLTQAFLILPPLPFLGELKISGAILFDLGVLFTVTGSLLSILSGVSR